jgi:hypothetical protein
MRRDIFTGMHMHENKKNAQNRGDVPCHRPHESSRIDSQLARDKIDVPRSRPTRKIATLVLSQELLYHGESYSFHDRACTRRESFENHAVDPQCVRCPIQQAISSHGHVWYDRFKSHILPNLMRALDVFQYISVNPVKAGLTGHPLEFEFNGVWNITRMKYEVVDPPNIVMKLFSPELTTPMLLPNASV